VVITDDRSPPRFVLKITRGHQAGLDRHRTASGNRGSFWLERAFSGGGVEHLLAVAQGPVDGVSPNKGFCGRPWEALTTTECPWLRASIASC